MKNTNNEKNNKFIGYCKNCELVLCGRDIISVNKWKCPSCDNEGLLSKLKKSKKSKKVDKMEEEVYSSDVEIETETAESKIISLEELEKLDDEKEEE